jgi:hypothetical protein
MPIFEWILILLAGAIVLTACARRQKLHYPSMLALSVVALLPNHPAIRDDAFRRIEQRLDYAWVNAR